MDETNVFPETLVSSYWLKDSVWISFWPIEFIEIGWCDEGLEHEKTYVTAYTSLMAPSRCYIYFLMTLVQQFYFIPCNVSYQLPLKLW